MKSRRSNLEWGGRNYALSGIKEEINILNSLIPTDNINKNLVKQSANENKIQYNIMSTVSFIHHNRSK